MQHLLLQQFYDYVVQSCTCDSTGIARTFSILSLYSSRRRHNLCSAIVVVCMYVCMCVRVYATSVHGTILEKYDKKARI